MFRYDVTNFREIGDLARSKACWFRQGRVARIAVRRRRMDDDMIGIFRPCKRCAGVTGLPAGLFAALLTQRSRLGGAFAQAVGRRRTIRVGAVRSELGFQKGDSCLEFRNSCLERENQGIFFIFAQTCRNHELPYRVEGQGYLSPSRRTSVVTFFRKISSSS